jgi:Transposase zinc-binding domain/Putative transposase/ABC transporter substrate binding protein
VSRPVLEVADIFRNHGPAWRQANAGHLSLDQLKVMSAIESCRTAALGGHVARCQDCAYTTIAYNSCRNRHCPKCQGAAAKQWLAERAAELLPVPYFHVVFTLPAPIADIAYQNKAVIYDLLFKVSAETMLTIAADPKHLGARIGITTVLHTWGSALTHHPHVHMIVPGGGIARDGKRWVSCRPGFFLPVRVLSRLFRRLFLERLTGLVASLNRPGGNMTGVSILTASLEAKRLELLHELIPNAAVIGVLVNPNFSEAESQLKVVQAAQLPFEQPTHFRVRNESPVNRSESLYA